MHDSILLEGLGVPTALLVTEAFVATAEHTAELAGAGGYRFAVLPHPLNRLTPEEVAERARLAVPRVLELLMR